MNKHKNKTNMDNDYGVFQDGTDLWVESADPLVLAEPDKALLMSEEDAETLAESLTEEAKGEITYRVGRPDDRHP